MRTWTLPLWRRKHIEIFFETFNKYIRIHTYYNLYIKYSYTYSWRGGKFYGIGGSRKYAYAFLDYELIGYKGVLVCICFFTFAILVISYLLVFFDYVRGNKKESDWWLFFYYVFRIDKKFFKC